MVHKRTLRLPSPKRRTQHVPIPVADLHGEQVVYHRLCVLREAGNEHAEKTTADEHLAAPTLCTCAPLGVGGNRAVNTPKHGKGPHLRRRKKPETTGLGMEPGGWKER